MDAEKYVFRRRTNARGMPCGKKVPPTSCRGRILLELSVFCIQFFGYFSHFFAAYFLDLPIVG